MLIDFYCTYLISIAELIPKTHYHFAQSVCLSINPSVHPHQNKIITHDTMCILKRLNICKRSASRKCLCKYNANFSTRSSHTAALQLRIMCITEIYFCILHRSLWIIFHQKQRTISACPLLGTYLKAAHVLPFKYMQIIFMWSTFCRSLWKINKKN